MATTEVRQPKQRLLKTQDNERHNVCAYCRVSTDETDQKNSLKSHQKFFESFFKKHSNWNNVRIFADEGLSGTSLEKRNAFNETLSLARYSGIDIIITKEVSRFSRNVQDLLNIVEELQNRGDYIWFLSDDINTESNDYRERLSQIATNAQQESLRTSRRVKWGQLQQMERGMVLGRKEIYGYNIVTDEFGEQHFEIIPKRHTWQRYRITATKSEKPNLPNCKGKAIPHPKKCDMLNMSLRLRALSTCKRMKSTKDFTSESQRKALCIPTRFWKSIFPL